MKKLICSLALSLVACQPAAEKASPEPAYKPVGVQTFAGLWVTPLTNFDRDQCAMRAQVKVEADRFELNDFLVHCVQAGDSGLYAPLVLRRAPRSQFQEGDLAGLDVPAAAEILTLVDASGVARPRGWLDEANRMFRIKVGATDSKLFNELGLFGSLVTDQQILLSRVEMREGYDIEPDLMFARVAAEDASHATYKQDVWNQIALPAGAVPSTSAVDQNFLFCTAWRRTNFQTLIDMRTPRYRVGADRFIGEIGIVDINGSRVVGMASTQSGVVREVDGLTSYLLSVNYQGSRASVQIEFNTRGQALLTLASYQTSLCRYLQNDVFKGRYPGW